MAPAVGRGNGKLETGIEELPRELPSPSSKCLDVDEHIEIPAGAHRPHTMLPSVQHDHLGPDESPAVGLVIRKLQDRPPRPTAQ